jgi:hypothetical protein
MPTQTSTSPPALAALSALTLSAEELAAVQRGGSVSRKPRGRHGFVFLLRFQLNGKQKAAYVGTDPALAKKIQAAIEDLQRPRKLLQRLRKRIQEVRQYLASIKPLMEPHVLAAGYHFHGRTIRRLRQPAEGTFPDPAAEAESARR